MDTIVWKKSFLMEIGVSVFNLAAQAELLNCFLVFSKNVMKPVYICSYYSIVSSTLVL